MPTQTISLIENSDTLAHFKEWAKAVSDWFAACGWVKTADAGQVDWAALGSVPLTGAYVYEMWGMGDALQASAPVYVKVEYRAGTNNNGCGMRFSTGIATDGNGNFVPWASGSTEYFDTGTWTATNCLLCGANNRMFIWMWPWQYPECFWIERSKDDTGEPNGDFHYWGVNWGGGAYATHSMIHTGAACQGARRLGPEGIVDTTNPSGAQLGIAVYPIVPSLWRYRNPLTDVVRGLSNDGWLEGDEMDLEIYPGKPHHYKVLRFQSGWWTFGSATWVGLWRWD